MDESLMLNAFLICIISGLILMTGVAIGLKGGVAQEIIGIILCVFVLIGALVFFNPCYAPYMSVKISRKFDCIQARQQTAQLANNLLRITLGLRSRKLLSDEQSNACFVAFFEYEESIEKGLSEVAFAHKLFAAHTTSFRDGVYVGPDWDGFKQLLWQQVMKQIDTLTLIIEWQRHTHAELRKQITVLPVPDYSYVLLDNIRNVELPRINAAIEKLVRVEADAIKLAADVLGALVTEDVEIIQRAINDTALETFCIR